MNVNFKVLIKPLKKNFSKSLKLKEAKDFKLRYCSFLKWQVSNFFSPASMHINFSSSRIYLCMQGKGKSKRKFCYMQIFKVLIRLKKCLQILKREYSIQKLKSLCYWDFNFKQNFYVATDSSSFMSCCIKCDKRI